MTSVRRKKLDIITKADNVDTYFDTIVETLKDAKRLRDSGEFAEDGDIIFNPDNKGALILKDSSSQGGQRTFPIGGGVTDSQATLIDLVANRAKTLDDQTPTTSLSYDENRLVTKRFVSEYVQDNGNAATTTVERYELQGVRNTGNNILDVVFHLLKKFNIRLTPTETDSLDFIRYHVKTTNQLGRVVKGELGGFFAITQESLARTNALSPEPYMIKFNLERVLPENAIITRVEFSPLFNRRNPQAIPYLPPKYPMTNNSFTIGVMQNSGAINYEQCAAPFNNRNTINTHYNGAHVYFHAGQFSVSYIVPTRTISGSIPAR